MIKNVLLMMASIVFAVLIIEAVLRFIYTPRPLEVRMDLVAAGATGDDSTLKWESSRLTYEPLQTGRIMHAEYQHSVSYDLYGFRNSCLQEPIEGILVGDSSVFGIGLEDQSTFQCLNQRLGKRTYTIGVSGAAPHQLIALVAEHTKRLQEVFSFQEEFYVQYILSVGGDFPYMASFNKSTPRLAKGRKNPEPRDESIQVRLNKLIYHDSIMKYSYVLQMLKLVAISAVPQCQDCNYIDLRGGDRIYRKNIIDSDTKRHIEAVVSFFDAASEVASKAGAANVQFVLLRGAHAINKQRLDRELGMQGASADEFNLDYQSDIIRRAAMHRPKITVIDPTTCLQDFPKLDDLHYEFDGHFTSIGARAYINCLSPSNIAAAGN